MEIRKIEKHAQRCPPFKQKLNKNRMAASHLKNVINTVSRLTALLQVSFRQRLLWQCHRTGCRSIEPVGLRGHGHVRVHSHAWRRGAGLT